MRSTLSFPLIDSHLGLEIPVRTARMALFDLISLINNPERVSDRRNKLIIFFGHEELFLSYSNIIKETNTFVFIIF